MPIYEYQGQQYDIATEDHAEAKAKILGYLDKQSAAPAAPAEPVKPKNEPPAWFDETAQYAENKPESVLQGGMAPVQPSPISKTVSPKFVASVQSALDSQPSEERAKSVENLKSRGGIYAQIAQDYEAKNAKLNQITSPTLKGIADRRLEAGTERFISQGLNAESSKGEAEKQALMGRALPPLQQMTPDVVGEKADKEAVAQAAELKNAGFFQRVGAETASRATQTGLGLMHIYADMTGDKQLGQDLMGARRVEEARQGAIPQGNGIFEKSAQQAISSLTSQATMLLMGALTGGELPVLAQAGIDVFGNEYGNARDKGLSAADAATRASLLSSAEVLFEHFGLTDELKALRGVMDRIPTDKVAGYLAHAIAKEIPSEQLTSATQFLIDKAPGIGLNPNAGWKDFLEDQAETLRQTVIQAGTASAGVIGTSKAANTLLSPGQTPVEPTPNAADYETLARAKGFLIPEAQQQTQQTQQTQQVQKPTAAQTTAPEAVVSTEAKPQPNQDVETLAQQISEATNIPIEDARRRAERELGIEPAAKPEKAAAKGAEKPLPTKIDSWTDAALKHTLDFQMQKPEDKRNNALVEAVQAEIDKRAQTEGTQNAAEPNAAPVGGGNEVAGQPGQVEPTAGVEGAQRNGVVSAEPNAAVPAAGESQQPAAVKTDEQLLAEADEEDRRHAEHDAKVANARSIARNNFESALDQVNSAEYNGDIDAAFDSYSQNTSDTLAEQGNRDYILTGAREFDKLVEEYKNKQKTPGETTPAPAGEATKEPAKRGRKPLAPEDKQAREVERKAARAKYQAAERKFSQNKEGALNQLAEANKPLDEGEFEDEEALAQAQEDKRAQKAAAINQLLDIEQEHRGTALGKRAKAVLNDRTKISQEEIDKVKKGREVRAKTDLRGELKTSTPLANRRSTAPADAKFSKATNGAQALTHIINTTKNPFQKFLAKRLRSFVGGVKFVVIEKGDPLPAQLQEHAADWEESRGLYIPGTKTSKPAIYVRGESFGEDQGANNVTVLHEMLHAATNTKINLGMIASARGLSTDAALTRFVGELNALMENARINYERMLAKGMIPPELRVLVESAGEVDPKTGKVTSDIFELPQEFLAYGMSDEHFQDFLDSIEGKSSEESGWSRFTRSIANLFGLGRGNYTALSDLMHVTDNILTSRKTKAMRAIEKGANEEVLAQAKKRTLTETEKALKQVGDSRTGEELGKAIGALHALKDPENILPFAKQAYDTADYEARKALAAAPSFDFLARWTRDTVPELTNTNVLLEKMGGMSQQLLARVGLMTQDIVRAYRNDPSLKTKLENVIYTSTLVGIDPSDTAAKKQDPELTRMYRELGPDGRRLYNMLRDYYRHMNEYYSDLLDQQIEHLDLPDETKNNLLGVVKTMYEGKDKIDPYFPLVRRGNFWLSFGRGAKRQFFMFESMAARDSALEGLAKKHGLDSEAIARGNDIRDLRNASANMSGILRKIFDAVDATDLTDLNAAEQLKDAIYQVYLNAMPEESFRKQFIHRKGVTGFSTDLVRNINSTGAGMSVQLARLKYAPLLRNSISQAKDSIEGQDKLQPFVDSARERVDAALSSGSSDGVGDAIAGAANKASFLWYLSGASSAILQPFSVYITGLPILLAHHGVGAAKELAKMVAYMNQYGIVRENPDGTRSYVAPSLSNNLDLPTDERQAVREMLQRGVTQSSYASEVWGYKSTPSENLYFDPSRGVIDNIPVAYGKGKQLGSLLVGGLMHNTERLSREAIYLASYRLGRKAGKTYDQAVDQAVIDTNEALGNYSMTNRPVFMQKGAGKVLLQFKMFPLHTTLLMLTNFKRMLPFLNKEGKREAAIKFFGIYATSFSVAGLVGVPAFSAVMGLLGWAWKEFGKDKDWPEDLKSLDFEIWYRTVFLPKHLGADMANLIEYGPLNKLTGMDLSSRLSLNNLWGRDTKETKTTRDGLIAAALSNAGPTASMILSLADARDAWNKGDTRKAVEKAAPAVVRNLLIWDRLREEGAKDYRGAQLLTKDQIKTGELVGQMIGFRPAMLADIDEKNFKLTGIETHINNMRAHVLEEMDVALRNRNMKGYRKAFNDLKEFNKAFPSYEIDADTLSNSLEKKQEQRGSAYVGITPTEKNMPIIQEALVNSRKAVRERK